MDADPITLAGAAGFASVWLWENFGKEITEKLASDTKNKWTQFSNKTKWQNAAEKYREHLKRNVSQIRLLGKSEPVQLENIFTDVYILDEVTARRRFDIETLIKSSTSRFDKYHDATRTSGMALVRAERNLYILGKPGAGKTTFLKYVALQALNFRINKVPIYVSLKDLSISDHKDLLSYLDKQFEICNFPEARPFIEYLLISGKALLLLDGLDEVNQENDQRANVINLIEEFSKQYQQSQYLVTCRIAASEFAFSRFQDVEVADFTDEQVKKFVNKWFADNKAKGQKFLEEFALPDNEGLRELGTVPLLLTLLCIAFDATMSFPRRRAELYEEALDALLKKWDSSRNIRRDVVYRDLSPRLKQGMFSHIAADTFEKGIYFISQRDLEKRILDYVENLPIGKHLRDFDSEVILESIESQHGIFIERAHQIYSFSHLTFHEYYTAKYITNNEARNTTKRLIDKHLTDNRWREVFLLVASLLDEADDFFAYFAQKTKKIISHDQIILDTLQRIRNLIATFNTDEDLFLTLIEAYIKLEFSYMSLKSQTKGYEINFRQFNYSLFADYTFESSPGLLIAFSNFFARHSFDHKPDLSPPLHYLIDARLTFLIIVAEEMGKYLDADLALKGFVEQYNSLLTDTVNMIKEGNLREFARFVNDIENLEINSAQEMLHFGSKLRKILIAERSIGNNSALNKFQIKRFQSFVATLDLLLDCLDVAGYVKNRQQLEHLIISFEGK